MTPASRTRSEILEEALTHLRYVPTYAAEGLSSQLVLDAVAMRLSVGIQALSALDAPTRQRMFGDMWPQMWATRNRLSHAYSLANPEIMQATVRTDVPLLLTILEKELDGS